jgi:hypothetical protein
MTADMDEKQPLVGDAEKGSISKHEGGPGSSIPLLMQQYKIPLIILYYGLCSSTLIVINKVAVHNITVRQPRIAVCKLKRLAAISYALNTSSSCC